MSQPSQFGTQDFLGHAEMLQQRVAEMRASLETVEVTGSAAGGAVTVRVTALGEFTSVVIDPAVVDRDDVTHLESLVLGALRDVNAQMRDATQRRLAGITDAAGRPVRR